MQAVKITAESEAFVGTSTILRNIFTLPEDTKIFWAGSRIFAKRLCGKDIVISKVDIFCEGQLQKGEYIREKSIPISIRAPPTVKERNLNYQVRSEISLVKPGTKAEEEYFHSETPIFLKGAPLKTEIPHPVEVSITGIKVRIDSDQFQPGDTLKIDYNLEKFKEFIVHLVKDANITCNCPDYAPTCTHIKPKPPASVKSVKAGNLTSGTLQILLPSTLELTHRYQWEPAEKTRWKETYGDYVNWSLELVGTRASGENVKLQIPITIYKKPTPEDGELFSSKQATAPIFQKILVPDSIEITKPNLDQKKLSVNLQNNSKTVLNGVTVKIVPIESEFFELPPQLTGINEWRSGTEIQAFHNNVGSNIKSFQVLIEDNSGNIINKSFRR